MQNISKKLMIPGSIVATAILGLATPSNANVTAYSNLGSGAEVRSDLLNHHAAYTGKLEAKCGAGKDSTAAKSKGKEGKCGEGKCGEGKCGGKKDGKATKKEAKATKKEAKKEATK
ncbi:hypothetical protein LX64_02137 [Chitinophaga skermanii]|uniref:Low-complexity protein n=1 Tax=Chitinophaga skermanii TaxID=331697 RepID=A0A327QST5_9BACT|nr:hypothetical protein [Chitinophaga skermanii]RAJ07008.1 hypothetical protein LX64_02137 [Chitinophaga skermanii]